MDLRHLGLILAIVTVFGVGAAYANGDGGSPDLIYVEILNPADGAYVGGTVDVYAIARDLLDMGSTLNEMNMYVNGDYYAPDDLNIGGDDGDALFSFDSTDYSDGDVNITVTAWWTWPSDENYFESDTIFVHVDNTAPEVNYAGADYYTGFYAVHFDANDASLYDVYTATVGRYERCSDANYGHVSGHPAGEFSTTDVSIDFTQRACVKVVDIVGNESYAEYYLPEPTMYLDGPEGDYVDEWPVFSGQHGNVMQDTTDILGHVQCGQYYWDGNAWTMTDTNFEIPNPIPTGWDFSTEIPPVEGNCVFTAYHVTEIRGTAEDSTEFTFDKTAPELALDGYDMDENGFIANFDVSYAPVDEQDLELNAYIGHVDRNEDCADANYIFAGQTHDGDTISERIAYHDHVCVRVVDVYGQSDEANAILPDPIARIDVEELELNYHNNFPEEISGTLENWMADSSVVVMFECNGPNGDYWYDGENWNESTTQFEPDHGEHDWIFDIYELPPTLGYCKVTVLHLATFRPTGGAAEGFFFSADELNGSVLLGEGEPVANGCGNYSPYCAEGERDISVDSELNGWGPIASIEVRCDDGNWFQIDPETYEEAYGEHGTSIMEMSGFVPDGEAFYNECMQEGNVVLYVHVTDHFGRETTFSDDTLYHKDAWGVLYILEDFRDEEDMFRPVHDDYDVPEWYFIGIPVIPYFGRVGEIVPECAESVWLYTEDGWKVFRRDHPELSDLNEFEQGRAYMVRMPNIGVDNDCDGPSMVIWGHYQPETNTTPPVPSTIVTLHRGWNPIAFDIRPGQAIDAETAFSALVSKEVYTLGSPYDWDYDCFDGYCGYILDYSGHYWVMSMSEGWWGMPVYGKKGYWVYTTDDNVDIHSKYNFAGWWR